ncbi:MAG: TIGR03746 family integrating conjugative element protein [Gammaproteobacteria bacterium]|nr:TIGR03746 family integrating conjugative element protein [Gammaproteobacteria bacterium]
MSRYRNALAGQREAIRALWGAVGVALVCALILGIGWMTAPNDLRIHIPPDLSAGATVRPDAPAPPHVYTFGLYIWQQLYRWPNDGAREYPAKLDALVHFLTPACRQDRLDDFAERNARRELAGRQRAVWEIPGRGYAVERVFDEGGGSWVVSLDLMIEETVLGERVKSPAVAYPVRVVRYDVDRELNPWGLALDCLAGVPRAIELAEDAKT